MKISRLFRKRTLSIRAAFFSFPALFILGALLPAAYFLFASANKSGEAHAYERLTLESEHIHLHLEHIFSLAQKINATNAALIAAGNLDEQSQDTLEKHFLAEIKEFEFL